MKSTSRVLSSTFFLMIFLSGYSQESNFDVSAYLDFYYAYDFYDPAAKQRQYVTQAARHNEFNLNLGFIQTEYASDNLRGNLAIQIGTYPTANYGGEPNAFAQLIQNASVGARLGEKTWIDAGVMGGHFGYEGLLSMDNELYTQALATEYTPYYQTGVQLSSELSEKLNFRAVVINGWQNIYETNNGKSFGIGLDYAFNDKWGISYGNYIGEDPVNGEDRLRFHNNFYLTYTGEKFSSAFVVDYMFEDLSNSQELALNQSSDLYFITFINQYRINDSWKLAGRYEYVEDPTNVLFSSPTGIFQSNIVTLALRRSISEQAVFSMEFRQFFGEEDIWRSRENEEGASNAILSAGFAMRFF